MLFKQKISTIIRTSQTKTKEICLFKDINLDYSQVEVASDTRHSARCCGRPPLLRCNKVDGVRSARPKGKRCRHRMNILPYSDVVTKVSADFMNNSG